MAEKVSELNPEFAHLHSQVFEYLANHPNGTRLTELEQQFRLARIQIARVLRSLIDEDKVEKRDFLYFAL